MENSLEKWFSILKPSGTLAIISFHSLEDRIVKHKFKEIFQNDKSSAKILTKRPLIPTELEIEEVYLNVIQFITWYNQNS